MFRFLYKNLSQNLYRAQGLTRNLETQSLKSNLNSQNQHSPTVSYLINSCGLSLDSAISVSKKFNIGTTEKADSVLQLFKTYGFTKEQITNLIFKYPKFLVSDPNKTLKPNFECLHSLGFSKPDLANLIRSDVSLLTRSLNNRILPTITFLKTFLPKNEDLTAALKRRSSSIFNHDLQVRIIPNISALRAIGVPDSNISRLLKDSARAVAAETHVFNQLIGAVKELGFDPKSMNFVLALNTFWRTGKSCWEKKTGKSYWENKVEVFKSFGLSEEDVLLAFKLQPTFMRTSESKIKLLMDIYVNKFGIKPSDLAKSPKILMFSLENRIIPRCSVLHFLLSKGLIVNDFSIIPVLCSNKMAFEKRFVTKYMETTPEVVKAYEGEMGYPNLGDIAINFVR